MRGFRRSLTPCRLAFALVSCCAGCNAGDGGGGTMNANVDAGGGGSTEIDTYAAGLKSGTCDFITRCFPVFASYYACYHPEIDVAMADLKKAVALGHTTFHPDQAQACLAALKALPCPMSYAGTRDVVNGSMDCKRVFTGTQSVGQSCAIDAECQSGACNISNGACPGTCGALLAAAADCSTGGRCDFTAGLYCIRGKCAQQGAAGAACDSYADCQAGLVCVSNACAQPGTTGASCSPNSFDCAPGFYCLPNDKTLTSGACQPQLEAGVMCAEDTLHLLAQAYECKPPNVCKGVYYENSGAGRPGMCAAPSDVGQSCLPPPGQNGASEGGCKGFLACVQGICQIPPATGSCMPDIDGRCDQRTAYCDASDMCQPKVVPGGGCTSDVMCPAGSRCGGSQACQNGCHLN